MRSEWVRKPAGATSVVLVQRISSSGESCWRHPNGTHRPELLKNEPELDTLGIYVYTYQTDYVIGMSATIGNKLAILFSAVFS